jgi:thymidylate synthase
MKHATQYSIITNPDFGYAVHGHNLGEAWLGTMCTVLTHGVSEPDESRNRIAIQSFRIKSDTQRLPDILIERYAKKENVQAMIDLVFHAPTMRDFDIIPNFRVGAKSYKTRIEEGDLLGYVVDRLATIPESKKAIMVFPMHEDYRQVRHNHWNDYLPCIVSIQFRLRPEVQGVRALNTIFHMRSWNIDQKGAGDLTIMAMLNHIVGEKLAERTGWHIVPGTIDGFITDVHIYQETMCEAQATMLEYSKS